MAFEVVSQTISLTIDTATHSALGWTELTIEIEPTCKQIQLHAFQLNIENVLVDKEAVEYKMSDHRVPSKGLDINTIDPDKPAASTAVNCAAPTDTPTALCDTAAQNYEKCLRDEINPELAITLPVLPAPSENDKETATKPRIKLRIEYSLKTSQKSGIHFFNHIYAITDNEARRASAWFPCVDIPTLFTPFELHLTVPANAMAIGPGQLIKQSWADVEKFHWKTFHYSVAVACAPCDIGFVVGPFKPVACQGLSLLQTTATLFVPHSSSSSSTTTSCSVIVEKDEAESRMESMVRHTSKFVALPLKLYANEILNAKFPFPSLQIAFLPREALRTETMTALGLVVLSTDMIIDPKSIEQSRDARYALALALAKQWFGHYVHPATYDDLWMVEGLAGWLTDQFIKRYMGRTEVAYHRWHRRQTVCLMDDGDAPPLSYSSPFPSQYPWGPSFGADIVDPSNLRRLKSAAVVDMLERRAGDEVFKKHVESLVGETTPGAVAGGDPASTAAGASSGADAIADNGVLDKTAEAAIGIAGSTRIEEELPEIEATIATTDQYPKQSRTINAASFALDIAKVADFSIEIEAFLERWVRSSGAPRLTLGFRFHRRGCILEIALQQSGSEAAKLGAQILSNLKIENSGIIKVSVREGSGATIDHPVAIGVNPVVSKILKVNPEVKRVPGKRGRKRKDEEDRLAEIQAAQQNAQHPLQWVRLDPNGEWLCSSRVVQPERMLNNQLKDSKDVVAQIEAVRSLGSIRVSTANQQPLQTLLHALEDAHLNFHVRMEAAHALGAMKNDSDSMPAGRKALMDYYEKKYFYPPSGENGHTAVDGMHHDHDDAVHDDTVHDDTNDNGNEDGDAVVKSVFFTDASEYLVAQAVVAAIATPHHDTDNPVQLEDVLLFLDACLEQYSSAWSEYDDRGILAAMCKASGAVTAALVSRLEQGDEVYEYAKLCCERLEHRLNAELVSQSPGFVVGIACMDALVDVVCSSDLIPEARVESVKATLIRFSRDAIAPMRLRAKAHGALVKLIAWMYGWPIALEYALTYTVEIYDVHKNPDNKNDAFVFPIWEEIALLAPTSADPSTVPKHLLLQMISLIVKSSDFRLRHLVYIAMRRLQGLPPNFYKPRQQKIKLNVGVAVAGGGVAESGGDMNDSATKRVDLDTSATEKSISMPTSPNVPVSKFKLKLSTAHVSSPGGASAGALPAEEGKKCDAVEEAVEKE